MDYSIIAAVIYNGKSKLINIDGSSKFEGFVKQFTGTFGDLYLDNLSFSFSIGGVQNCVLDCDSDLRNMCFLCHESYQNLVVVNVINKVSESNGCNMMGKENCDPLLGKEFEPANTSSLMGKGPESHLLSSQNSGKKSIREDNLTPTEFSGDGSIPHFDVCPIEKRKPLLSDEWGEIMKPSVGLEFVGCAAEFRVELIKYTTQTGYKFKYFRNDPRYIHVVCTDQSRCDWFIKAKRRAVNSHFVVSKACLVHTCVGKLVMEKKNRVGASIISTLVLEKVKSNPTISGKNIILDVKQDYGMDIPYWKAWRSIEAARDEIFGSFHESYDQLRWYCDAIIRTNPGSVVDLQKKPQTNHFERLFVAFKSCIDGFKYCRLMLFVDGNFMKGRAKGVMLAATAKDGDNGLFPVAFAIVSAETKDNWIWFLEKLRDFVKHDKQVMYISNRNKGLMAAFPIVFENPVHFFCLYHLLTNLKGKFAGGWTNKCREKLGDLFKECAYAPTVPLFEEKLNAFIELGGHIAEKFLEDMPLEKWVVSHSPNIRRYGEMTSNAAESYNAWIKEARSLPITYMIDSIRKGICRWYVERREASNLWNGALCQSKEAVWHHLTEIGRKWFVVECPNGQYEVSSKISVIVCLATRCCSCYQWQIRGFPCAHAVAVIRKHCTTVYDHVESCFLTSNYRECYKSNIIAVPEVERFNYKYLDEEEKILPPILKNPPRRPKKLRKPSFGEFRRTKPTFCPRYGKTGRHDPLTCSVRPIE